MICDMMTVGPSQKSVKEGKKVANNEYSVELRVIMVLL